MFETEINEEKVDRNIKKAHVRMGFQSLADLLVPYIICMILSVVLACVPYVSAIGSLAMLVIQIIYFVRLKRFGNELNNYNLKKAVNLMIANVICTAISFTVLFAGAIIMVVNEIDNMTFLYIVAIVMGVVSTVLDILYINAETTGFAEVVAPFNQSEAANWDSIRGIMIASSIVSSLDSIVKEFDVALLTLVVALPALVLAIVSFVKKWKAIYSCKDLYDMYD